jgi:hypothetical protein
LLLACHLSIKIWVAKIFIIVPFTNVVLRIEIILNKTLAGLILTDFLVLKRSLILFGSEISINRAYIFQ